MDLFETVWGHGSDLTVTQMTIRAVLTFMITLVLIRVAGRRSFGQRSAFDSCVVVLLGSVLSRAVVGASPYAPTVAACIAMVIAHRLLAHLSMHSQFLDSLINGKVRELFHDQNTDRSQMRAGLITDVELSEALRKHGQTENRSQVAKAVLEQSGA